MPTTPHNKKTLISRVPLFRARLRLWIGASKSVIGHRPSLRARSLIFSDTEKVGNVPVLLSKQVTSMIGNRQGKTEISLDLVE